MRVNPAIAALRRDRTLQQRAQAALFAVRDAWQANTRVAPVLDELSAFGRGAALSTCPALAGLFASGAAAERLAATFCTTFAGALAGEPFDQLPFRHGFDGALATLLLARAGSAQLTLLAQEPGEYAAANVLFSDADRLDAVLAGEASARLTERRPDGALEHDELRLAAGHRVALDRSRQALFVRRVDRRLVTLRLRRSGPGAVREHSLADGRLLRQAAGDVRQSRHEMMLTLLARMHRREAAPLIAEIARDEGPDALRWQALREALALDTAHGFAALCRIARSPADPLAAPAGTLRAQLVEAHPELRAFEEAQCRE